MQPISAFRVHPRRPPQHQTCDALLELTAVQFEIGHGVSLRLVGGDERTARALRAALDPYNPTLSDLPPDVTIEPLSEEPVALELQNAAGDGLVTAWDGTAVFVQAAMRWCRVPLPALTGPFVFAYQPGFPLARVFNPFVRPALQIAASARGVIAVHGAAVVADGRGVVLAGWSESGKTETALAFMEEGATFLSDKWTLVASDATISCFPISVGVRRWMLRYAPTLRTSLPAPARLQLRLAGVAAALNGRPARERLLRGRIGGLTGDALDRIVALAERAAISPTALSATYGDPPPAEPATLEALVLLTTIPGVLPSAEIADPAWAARRLARSATYERRRYLDLHRRVRYAQGEPRTGDVEAEIEDREERHLHHVLQRVRVIEARAPFPCDPRRIVDAVRPLL
jgi:hypothetical protein